MGRQYEVASIFTLKDNFTAGIKKMINGQDKFAQETAKLQKQLQDTYNKKRQLQLDMRDADKALKKAMKLGGDLTAAINKKIELELQTGRAEKEIKSTLKAIKDIDKQTRDLNGRKAKPTIEVNDKASKVLDSIGGKIKSIAGGTVKGLFYGGAALTAGAGAATYHALNIAGTQEQTQMAFETMLKSPAAGQKMMSDLKNFAVATPFEFQDIAKNAQYAMAMGFKQNDMMGLLTDAGDAASGTGRGVEGMENIIRALGQMQQKGKVSAQEINQLAENGIGAWNYIAKAIHKTTAETMKLAEDGLIPADKAILAIRKGMRQDYSGMMEKQSKTLFGLMSTIKDFVNLNVFGAFGNGIKNGILPFMARFVDGLTKNQGGLDNLQKKLEDVGRTIGDCVGKKAEGLYKYFDKLFNDPAFQNSSLGDKAKRVLDDIYTNIKSWFDGGGGDSIKKAFEDATRVAMDALIVVATEYVPKFAEVGLKIGESMADGMLSAVAKKFPMLFQLSQSNPLLPSSGNLAMYFNQEFTKTLLSKDKAYSMSASDSLSTSVTKLIMNTYFSKDKQTSSSPYAKAPYSRAIGVRRIPSDNYPIIAHEGETLLTKQESNSIKNSKPSITINLTVNGNVTDEGYAYKIARIIVGEVDKVNPAYGGAY